MKEEEEGWEGDGEGERGWLRVKNSLEEPHYQVVPELDQSPLTTNWCDPNTHAEKSKSH